MSHLPYTSVVGNLMYAMVCMRSDLSQVVSMVSRYMHDPDRGHWEAVKWISRYIKGTVDVGLVFKKDTDGKLMVTPIMHEILVSTGLGLGASSHYLKHW